MAKTQAAPDETVCVAGKGSSPSRPVTIDETGALPGHLVKAKVSTYANGVEFCAAAHGTDNDGAGFVEILEILAVRKTTWTSIAYDKTTVFTAGDSAIAVRCQEQKTYWVKPSAAFTGTAGALLKHHTGGVLITVGDHDITPVSMHIWLLEVSVSAKSWLQCTFLGKRTVFTADS